MAARNSPLIAQYLRVKQSVPDAILFFRLGDFYEMFFEDAETGSRILDIQLTSRSKDGVPLCGVPYHAAEPYIAKLLKAGLKVAICEQAGADGNARGLMAREIVRVITPGTVAEETVLTASEKSFLCSVAADGDGYALAALDVSSGEFLATRITGVTSLREEISRLRPREVLIPKLDDKLSAAIASLGYPVTQLDESMLAGASDALARRTDSAALAAGEAIAAAAGAALLYVEQTFGSELAHLRPLRVYRAAEYMMVDETSRRHLELVVSSDGARNGTLLSVLDETATPVGSRTLSHWIVYPLLDRDAIGARHDAVEEFFEADLSGEEDTAMRRIGDLERLAGRIGSMRASPRDCQRLAQALGAVATLKDSLMSRKSALVRELAARLDPHPELARKISETLCDEPPVNPREGNAIRTGFDPSVDELRALAGDARGVIARLESRERDRSRIPSLKVRFNQVFGYYIEVTRPHLDRVPADYERKQTLVGAERFTTPELKELERKIMGAESGLKELELQIFTKLLRDLNSHAAAIQATASAMGELDALMALARVARRRGYVRPSINGSARLLLRDGRHPVLESLMKRGEFVPNDLDADPETRQLILITGPNMAGKSTYLRQVALIVIMAQMGSFVPAAEAALGIVDRVLTRIGARDEPPARRVHLHGRDARDGAAAGGSLAAKPAPARRSRARHEHL